MEAHFFDISQGVTMQGFLSNFGIVLIVIGIIALVAAFIVIGIIAIVVGVLLFLSIKGVLIDYSNKRIKSYFFFFFKIGDWIDISGFDHFMIRSDYSGETRALVTAQNTTFTKYSDLYLVNKDKTSEILIHSCRTKKYAIELMNEIAPNLGIKPINY